MTFKSIAMVASRQQDAQDALKELKGRYKLTTPSKADAIVALGGDGFMLRTLHKYLHRGVPIYGMNRGTVGFLMNEYHTKGLRKRLEQAHSIVLHPLRMCVTDMRGKVHEALAFNEVSLLRHSRLAAKLRISVDGKTRMEEMICDGALLSTPAGSTAYNLSAHGPIIPLGAELLALTPISAFRPRQWRGALLPAEAKVRFEIIDPQERPVSAVADDHEVERVRCVEVVEDRSITQVLLFDPEHNLEERILREQFLV
ncbi:MAG: NAD kinase [Alphaproteobacteria bacterium]|nr:NAD kinase [Alphaproteobacteria bacterium]MBF0249598.1 NAD kinase [Alphaproteobacteria bacterium]